eukprot:1262204-Prymnesium_polylepis.1
MDDRSATSAMAEPSDDLHGSDALASTLSPRQCDLLTRYVSNALKEPDARRCAVRAANPHLK